MKNQTTNRPAFKRDDFLYTEEPFAWLEQFKKDDFALQQRTAQLQENAASVGIKPVQFTKLLKAFQKRADASESGPVENRIHFEGQPELISGPYICDGHGVVDYSTKNPKDVCLHPIFPIRRLVNVDTGEERQEIVYRKGKVWRTQIAEKAMLASSSKILELAAYGVLVTSENAKDLGRYLLEIEELNIEDFDVVRSVSRLGWTAAGFSPYLDGVKFDGEMNFKRLWDAVQPHGDLKAWVRAVESLREHGIAGRIILAASFASVLLEPLGILPFFLHVWGGTGTGKTVALMAAASAWASPAVGGFVNTFNSTSVGMERLAGFLNSLPLCIDELQIQHSAGERDFDKLIYQLTEGTGRTRGAKTGGLQAQETWRNVIVTTGEQPILSSNSGGGAVNRIVQLELVAELAPDLPDLCRIISENYGHAGRAFVDYLQQDGVMAMVRKIYDVHYKTLLNVGSTDKQAASAAVILTADNLITDLFFGGKNQLTAKDIQMIMMNRDDVDVNRRALEYILDLVAANNDRFTDNTIGEMWGSIDRDKNEVCFIRTVFEREMERSGFNSKSFLRWADRCGFLDHTDGRMSKLTRFGSDVKRTIGIYVDKAEHVLDPSLPEGYTPDDQIPF